MSANGGETALEMVDITKTFPGVRALDRVTLRARRGEIHAICGENGAGKSTLMKILSGYYPVGTYEGVIRIGGVDCAFRSIRDAERAGVAIIHQELALVRELSVADNLLLGHERVRAGLIRRAETYATARFWLEKVGLSDVDPREKVGLLGVGKQQLVEIAKALLKRASILILDEPTAALTEAETERLHRMLIQLKGEGVTCLYISHRLGEVFRIADTVTVLRDGRTVGTHPAGGLTEDRVIAMMVGRELTERFPPPEGGVGEVAFCVERWSVRDPGRPGGYCVRDVGFEVRAGEVVGIAGLMGSGRTELAMSLFGAFGDRATGNMYVGGRPCSVRSPQEAIASGIALVTEDRKRYGLVPTMNVRANMTLASIGRFARFGLIRTREEGAAAREYAELFQIRLPSFDSPVLTLSGGNQQKVLLARALLTRPRVLVLDEPTRGVDVGAKYEIYRLVRRFARDGAAVVLISSELPEVLGMSDRVLVMREGRLVGELHRGEATQEAVMRLAAGGMPA